MSFPDTLLLTGGTGFLGKHLRKHLANNGVQVTLLVHPDSLPELRENERTITVDLRAELDVSLRSVDAIAHFGALTDVSASLHRPKEYWDVNATGTLRLLEAVRKADVDTFLFTSTASVYGVPDDLPITESHQLQPIDPYGASKAAADQLVRTYHRSYGIPSVVARLFNVFGYGQSPHNVVPAIITQALNDSVVELGNLSPTRDFIHVSDVIDALVTLLERGPSGEAYNVGRGQEVSIGEMAETAVQVASTSAEIVSKKDKRRDEAVEIPRHRCDPSKLEALGWRAQTSIQDGIEETITNYRRDGQPMTPSH